MIRIPRALARGRRAFARAGGYFWLPCPCCGRDFGGFEAGHRSICEEHSGYFTSWTCCRWCDRCAGAREERRTLDELINVPSTHEVWLITNHVTSDEWRCAP